MGSIIFFYFNYMTKKNQLKINQILKDKIIKNRPNQIRKPECPNISGLKKKPRSVGLGEAIWTNIKWFEFFILKFKLFFFL